MIILNIHHENEHLLLEIAHDLIQHQLINDALLSESFKRIKVSQMGLSGKTEYLMLCKTREGLYETIENHIRKNWLTSPPISFYATPVLQANPEIIDAVISSTHVKV